MKRTKIEYRKLDKNNVIIVSIENAASTLEIAKEFGADVRAAYLYSQPHYFRTGATLNMVVINYGGRGFNMSPGRVIDVTTFGRLINAMKQAGDRLCEIKKITDESETILI